MRGHSTTPQITASPEDAHSPASFAKNRSRPAGLCAALGALVLLGLSACGYGYGGYEYGPAPDITDYTGRLALAWTLGGKPLTADLCTSDKIDSMQVQILSDEDSSAYVEFDSVVCALDKYSVAMVPSGSVSVYVNAISQLSSRRQCVRYAGTAQTTATAQYPQTPVKIDLTAALNCP